jgi:hypothetical protein
MNWGNRLILVFFVFAGFMAYLAYRASGVNIDLVDDNYYKDELKYQDNIDGSKRVKELSSAVALQQDDKFVTVQFPEEIKKSGAKGTIWFYCASDVNKDRHITIQLDSSARQQIELSKFSPGNYVVKFDWLTNNEKYYTEKNFRVL